VTKGVVNLLLISLLFQSFFLFCMRKIDQIDDPMEYNVLTFLDTKDLGSVRLVCKKYKHWIDKFTEFLDQGEYKKNKKIKNLLKKMEQKLKNRDFIFLITKRKEILRVNKKNLEDRLFYIFDCELERRFDIGGSRYDIDDGEACSAYEERMKFQQIASFGCNIGDVLLRCFRSCVGSIRYFVCSNWYIYRREQLKEIVYGELGDNKKNK